MQLRVVLVDDHEVVRRGLKALFAGYSHWTVCGEAENGQDGVDLVAKLQPELVVLDLSMPVMNGIQAARKIREISPLTIIVVLSTHDSPQIVEESLRAGAALYLTKLEAGSDLIRMVDELFANPSNLARATQGKVTDNR